jgi:hypothetical protein
MTDAAYHRILTRFDGGLPPRLVAKACGLAAQQGRTLKGFGSPAALCLRSPQKVAPQLCCPLPLATRRFATWQGCSSSCTQ